MTRWLVVAVVLAGCPKHEPDKPPAPTTMGDATVSSSDPWAQARAVAEQSGASAPSKWRDDVPYLFQAKGSRGVLVHKGAVVTARGPAAVGAYLRDVGILEGKGPSARSILTLLFVLQAYPKVEGQSEESAFDMAGPEDLRPRVELVDGHAHVILNYMLPREPGPSRGAVPMLRETLDIGPTGDAAWTATPFEHAPL